MRIDFVPETPKQISIVRRTGRAERMRLMAPADGSPEGRTHLSATAASAERLLRTCM
jgi:hypothetical protein